MGNVPQSIRIGQIPVIFRVITKVSVKEVGILISTDGVAAYRGGLLTWGE